MWLICTPISTQYMDYTAEGIEVKDSFSVQGDGTDASVMCAGKMVFSGTQKEAMAVFTFLCQALYHKHDVVFMDDALKQAGVSWT